MTDPEEENIQDEPEDNMEEDFNNEREVIWASRQDEEDQQELNTEEDQ